MMSQELSNSEEQRSGSSQINHSVLPSQDYNLPDTFSRGALFTMFNVLSIGDMLGQNIPNEGEVLPKVMLNR